jgi:hypothetical protein
MTAAAARLTASIASLEAQAQLGSGWHGDAARAALLRSQKNLQGRL